MLEFHTSLPATVDLEAEDLEPKDESRSQEKVQVKEQQVDITASTTSTTEPAKAPATSGGSTGHRATNAKKRRERRKKLAEHYRGKKNHEAQEEANPIPEHPREGQAQRPYRTSPRESYRSMRPSPTVRVFGWDGRAFITTWEEGAYGAFHAQQRNHRAPGRGAR